MGNPQGTLTVTDLELGWLAGMIDGEGTVAFSVYWRKTETWTNEVRVKPQIIVSGTDKTMLERVADIIGRLGVGVHFQSRQQLIAYKSSLARDTTKYRPLHVVTVAGYKRTMKLLSIIGPHLVSAKGEKGRMMHRYMTRRLEKTAVGGRWATQDAEDLQLMLEIMRFSEVHNGKGIGPKYLSEIERRLRDITQNEQRQLPAA